MIALAATLSLLLAPPPAPATAAPALPQALVQDVNARATERGIDPALLLAPAYEAARQGLPGRLVAEKVLEGLAKGAPPDRIGAVSRGLLERLASSQAILVQAERSGLGVPEAERTVVLADLSGALLEGVPPGALRALVQAAQEARAADAGGVVAGARTLSDLHRRGVEVSEALPLAEALAARAGPGTPEQIVGLYDAWRSEGGREPRAFLQEARRRIKAGASLDGMVDPFAETPDRLVRLPAASGGEDATGPGSGKGKALGAGNNGKALGHGDVPGLSDGPPGRGKDKPKKNDK
ncbi:MAG: hypothetical protein QM767_25615 [Anaeromyxobacter sp.]